VPVTVTESATESEKESGKAFGIESEKASVTGSEMDAETNV
jgi:hypothetical protein